MPSSRRKSQATGAACEALELRRLLSSPLFYSGSGDDDLYTVRLKAGDATKLEVLESLGGGATTTYTTPIADVDSLTIETSDGYDSLTVDESNGPIELPLPISFDGGGDFDELIWDAGPAADVVSVYSDEIVDGDAGVQFAGAEDVIVNGNGNADSFLIESTDAAFSLALGGGGGNDSLSFVSGDLDDIQGDVTFDGGANTDSIVVDDSLSTFSDDYDLWADSVSRPFFAGLTYFNAEALTLSCQAGGNNIFLHATSAATPVTINGGDGNDLLFVTGATSSVVVFNGGLDAGDQDGLAINAGSYTFNAGATAQTAHLALGVSGATSSAIVHAMQHVETLTLTGGAKLDLRTGGAMAIRDAEVGTWNGSNYDGITGLIKAGRNGGAWNGAGIVTSMSGAMSPMSLTTVGVALASDVLGISGSQIETWNGEDVGADEVLLKYTYAGDANLDGVINGDDFACIDAGFSASVKGYFHGDFNYDGRVDADDYFLIDANYIKAQAALAPPAVTLRPAMAMATTASGRARSSLVEELFG